MNYFLKIRFTTWVIIILSVILLAVLGTLIFSRLDKDRFEKKPPFPHAGFEEMLKKELALTPDQQTKFGELRKKFEKIRKPIFDSLSVKRIEMVQEISKINPDTVLLSHIAEKIGMLQVQLRKATIKNILEMKSICTPEQRIKFNSLNQRLIEPKAPMHNKEMNKRNDHNRMPEGMGY